MQQSSYYIYLFRGSIFLKFLLQQTKKVSIIFFSFSTDYMLLVKNSDNDGTNSVEISYYSFIGFVILIFKDAKKYYFFIFWIRGECSLKGVDLSSQFSVLFF